MPIVVPPSHVQSPSAQSQPGVAVAVEGTGPVERDVDAGSGRAAVHAGVGDRIVDDDADEATVERLARGSTAWRRTTRRWRSRRR